MVGGKFFPFQQEPNEATGGTEQFISAKVRLSLGNTLRLLEYKNVRRSREQREAKSLYYFQY